MGTEKSLACLGAPATALRLLKAALRQVTNPPLEGIREELYPVATSIGRRATCSRRCPRGCGQIKIKTQIRNNEDPSGAIRPVGPARFKAATVSACSGGGGGAGRERRWTDMCGGERAVAEGNPSYPVRPRGRRTRRPYPACSATAGGTIT